jgi:SAM-dependent methyltransferase
MDVARAWSPRLHTLTKHISKRVVYAYTHQSNFYHQPPTVQTSNMPDDRERLRQHFQDQPAEAQTGRWDAMWQQNVTPWDRSLPNPALIDALDEKRDIIGASTETSDLVQRKKALVPGCGRGYDVLLLASYGYDAYGADVSQTAIDACNKLDQDQAEDTAKYPIKDASIGRGSRNFLLADFFNDDLLSHTGGSKFDVIYDYTFLCAIPPQLRPKWAARMSSLLAPGGSLICLEFPLAKSPALGGPPHGLSSDLYVQLFKRPGDDVKYGDDGYVVSEDRELDSQSGLVRAAHWQPERTHQAGKDTDKVSIWKHAGDSEGVSRSIL